MDRKQLIALAEKNARHCARTLHPTLLSEDRRGDLFRAWFALAGGVHGTRDPYTRDHVAWPHWQEALLDERSQMRLEAAAEQQRRLDVHDDLVAALKYMTAYAALNDDGCIGDESEHVDVMLNPDDPGNVGRTIDMARALIAAEGGE